MVNTGILCPAPRSGIKKKTKYLQSRGYIVLRFSEAVLKADIQSCGQKVVEALLSRVDAK